MEKLVLTLGLVLIFAMVAFIIEEYRLNHMDRIAAAMLGTALSGVIILVGVIWMIERGAMR